MHRAFLIIQVVLVLKVRCDTFVWTLTANMSDPINWESGFRPGQTNCLIMNPQNNADVVFGNMSISEIVLPKWATMFFEPNTTITFEEHTTSSTCKFFRIIYNSCKFCFYIYKILDSETSNYTVL